MLAGGFIGHSQIAEREVHAGIEVSQVAQAIGEHIVLIEQRGYFARFVLFHHRCVGGVFKDGCFGVEFDGGAMIFLRTFTYHGHAASGLAFAIFLHIHLAAAAHFSAQIVAQGVHTTHTHTVQTARHFVGAFVEFAAGVKHGHHHFECRFVQFFVHVHRYAAPVVAHRHGIVGVDAHFYFVAIPCQCFVDGVVHHFRHQVVHTLHVGVANIHSRALTHCFKAFKHLDV